MLEVLAPHLLRIDELYKEINLHVPQEARGTEAFRADLAGMFVVTCVAMYESCVKDALIDYASRRNPRFEHYVSRSFKHLNSRIRINDLQRYTSQFDDAASAGFKRRLNTRKIALSSKTGYDLVKRYDQLLDWRHSFAHSGTRNTTLEEAYQTHRVAKHVIVAFGHAFSACEDHLPTP